MFGGRVGYEDVDGAEVLRHSPARRWIVSGNGLPMPVLATTSAQRLALPFLENYMTNYPNSRLPGRIGEYARSAFLAAALSSVPVAAAWSDPITEAEAHSIGVEAYTYLYSPITMDITRKQLTNVEPTAGGIGGPANTFNNVAEFPAADLKVVVRPNFDTLYSSAWLDLTEEPVVISVPDTAERYYLLPMLDM